MTSLVPAPREALEEWRTDSESLVRNGDSPGTPEHRGVVRFLRAALAQAILDACAAEREVERLSMRVRELESWIDKRAQFDEVEHLQIGRMLAAAEARRIERLSRPIVSLRTVLLLAYCVVLASLAVLVVLGRI